MADFQSYVPDLITQKDISVKAVILGALFGAIFGSANAYLGLRVGLTISTAIPLAVISVAVLRVLSPLIGKSSILECNIAQTTGSASSSLASGIIFTIPALFLWGFNPSILKVGTLALLGGVLGVLFMIPLRKALIVKEHGVLPYPEETAAAQVLISAEEGGAKARNIFLGMEPTPALLGIGFILGPRIACIIVADHPSDLIKKAGIRILSRAPKRTFSNKL